MFIHNKQEQKIQINLPVQINRINAICLKHSVVSGGLSIVEADNTVKIGKKERLNRVIHTKYMFDITLYSMN